MEKTTQAWTSADGKTRITVRCTEDANIHLGTVMKGLDALHTLAGMEPSAVAECIALLAKVADCLEVADKHGITVAWNIAKLNAISDDIDNALRKLRGE